MRKWMDKGGAKTEKGYSGPTRGEPIRNNSASHAYQRSRMLHV